MRAPLRVFVLAAGLGTRLLPLTESVPKPLLWVGDRPQVEHVFAHLASRGLREVTLNTHHLAAQFSDVWAARQPVQVVRIFEQTILGTGGALANAAEPLGDGDVLLWNADMFGEPDLDALAAHHEASGAAATLLVGPPTGRGTVGLDREGFVRRIRAFDRADAVEAADYLGIAIVSRRLRERLRAPGCLVEQGLIPSLEAGETIATVRAGAPIVDVGSLAALLDTNLAWLAARGLERFVDPTAVVEAGATLDRVVVGPGARVTGRGVLREALVLPNAELALHETREARSIFSPTHRVAVGPPAA